LKNNFDHILVIYGFAHALNLVIQETISNFPVDVVDIVSKISVLISPELPKKGPSFQDFKQN